MHRSRWESQNFQVGDQLPLNSAAPASAATLAYSEHAQPNVRRSVRADGSAGKPAAPAARWDIPIRWLPQTPPALLLEPACEKPRPAPVAASAGLPAPGARSPQLSAAQPERADRGCPSAQGLPADAPILADLLLSLSFSAIQPADKTSTGRDPRESASCPDGITVTPEKPRAATTAASGFEATATFPSG